MTTTTAAGAFETLFLWLLLLLLCHLPQEVAAQTSSSSSTSSAITGVVPDGLPCRSTADCEARPIPGRGSQCIDGYCTNPFFHGGCLHQRGGGGSSVSYNNKRPPPQLRVCHSEDPHNNNNHNNAGVAAVVTAGEEEPICRVSPPLAYPELRLASQNWESSVVNAWVLQIILSELLDVPTTVETGSLDAALNFYHPYSRLDLTQSTSADWTAFRTAATVRDCRKVAAATTTTTTTTTTTPAQQQQQESTSNDSGSSDSTTTVVVDPFVDTEEEDAAAATAAAAASYRSCAHVAPEIWFGSLLTLNASGLVGEGLVEPPMALGMSAYQTWFVPRYTAQRDPTLVSWIGLQGSHNRRKLAQRFLRPTTWGDYCTQVSPDHCTNANNNIHVLQETNETIVVATRAPVTPDEADSFFVEGLYAGHFRKTPDNDCETYPDTCTGHYNDYPCSWTSYVRQQAYHLDIALDSSAQDPIVNQYGGSRWLQVWKAAHATQSDVIGVYYYPDPLWPARLGTSSEFMQVLLPPVTQECLDHRITSTIRCHGTEEENHGSPVGACQDDYEFLNKVFVSNLQEQPHSSSSSGGGSAAGGESSNGSSGGGKDGGSDKGPAALASPALETIRKYQMTTVQMMEILEGWLEHQGGEDLRFFSREQTCAWVVQNLDWIQQSFVPATYPRVVHHEPIWNNGLHTVAVLASSLAMAVVLVTGIQTFLQRRQRVIFFSQIEVLYLIQGGFLLVAVGATLKALTAQDPLCAATPWFVNLGYVVAYTPVVMRLHGIHRSITLGKRMRYFRLREEKLFACVLVLAVGMAVFVLVWELTDPPRRVPDYVITSQTTANGETILLESFYCASAGSDLWEIVGAGWRVIFCLCTAMLAFLMASQRHEDVNDTKALSTLAASNFAGAVVYLITVLAVANGGTSVKLNELQDYQSLILSLDALASLILFILPKLWYSRSGGGDDKNKDLMVSDPLPDLFLRTTIMYAEITGFSAWSSVREPAQVFKFLESVWWAFDKIANQRHVFKVETVADTYVAATGIPHPQADHAVIMADFALDCLDRMRAITTEQELVHGPKTGNLSIRIGLHSGPVTGGFLQGKGSRFQLFGETVNTTRQVEATGLRGRIQVSEATAKLLMEAKKEVTVVKREGKIAISGLAGEMQMYWLKRGGAVRGNQLMEQHLRTDVVSRELNEITRHQGAGMEQKKRGLIDWNVAVLQQLIRKVVVRRNAVRWNAIRNRRMEDATPVGYGTAQDYTGKPLSCTSLSSTDNCEMPLDEVKDVIMLPEFDRYIVKRQEDPDDVELPREALDQLKFYVTTISAMYRNNPFHNFAHASHVVMAVVKYMNRIIAASELELDDARAYQQAAARHDHTYGITSDPLTQFACVFAALIHDLDHPGVPNTRFIDEEPHLAAVYKQRSVAEQNSFDLSWNVFMDDQFKAFRELVCGNSRELRRLRQLVINCVMATDLADKDLKALRNGRWDRAFLESTDDFTTTDVQTARIAVNRKATIVIEHLIQASDVSHTMQHWDIYREWNENLFMEMYGAYRSGRAAKNPAEFWYKGEIGFLDLYVIPLSKKLSDCGVFGISSDENLNYVARNRELWVQQGAEVVQGMLQKALEKWGPEDGDDSSASPRQIAPLTHSTSNDDEQQHPLDVPKEDGNQQDIESAHGKTLHHNRPAGARSSKSTRTKTVEVNMKKAQKDEELDDTASNTSKGTGEESLEEA